MPNMRQHLLPFERPRFVQTLNCYNSVNIAARLTKMPFMHSAAHGASIRVKEDNLQQKHICGLAPLFEYKECTVLPMVLCTIKNP